jgi:hypothetical protein
MTQSTLPACLAFLMLIACSSSSDTTTTDNQNQSTQDIVQNDSNAESSDTSSDNADGEPIDDTAAAGEAGPTDISESDDGESGAADGVSGDDDASDDEATGDGISESGSCPTALIQVEEGDAVLVQTLLHLSAAESIAVEGAVSAFEWSVLQPDGSVSLFTPNATKPDPTFEANVAGSYVFNLDVWDDKGVKSCETATYSIAVMAGMGIHVELLWRTPGDEDESDEGPTAGADLDLHFTHPSAEGLDFDDDGTPDGWFDQPFDCFWMNPNPNWGDLDLVLEDDPSLDRDDTDGAGPENLNLVHAEDDTTYAIGVHYWGDHGFGVSYATIKVYVDGLLAWSNPVEAEMNDNEFWDVGTIHWASGMVTPTSDENGGMVIYGTAPTMAGEDSW